MGEDIQKIPESEDHELAKDELTLNALGADNTIANKDTDVNETPDMESQKLNNTEESTKNSVAAKSHAKNRSKKSNKTLSVKSQKKWQRNLGFAVGVLTLSALILGGILGQYYKGRTMPGVVVADLKSSAKSGSELKNQLENQYRDFKVTIISGDKKLEPKLENIGLLVDVNKTIENSLKAKRDNGIIARLSFWRKYQVPAVITINDTILGQYLEANLPELTKPAQDSMLNFDTAKGTFVITDQANGQGPDVKSLKAELIGLGNTLKPSAVKINQSIVKPVITQSSLKPLLEPANNLVSKNIVFTGLGYTYKASPAQIASWITPTPQEDGSVKLVVDPAKIQSYVEEIGKKISNPPQDQKVLKDESTGAEVVLQAGRNGTELADRQVLANAVAEALKDQRDLTQTMNIQTAAFKTVNMNAYDKWIEVDLSEQRTTAYEKATPVKNFLIASGMRGYETVTGEFSIWLKVRSQTMSGGSKADGSYYNLPNVEWVSYFYKDYALHGAYWRKVFGYPASHGCVNMTNEDAHWVYDWAPVGTKVIVHQ